MRARLGADRPPGPAGPALKSGAHWERARVSHVPVARHGVLRGLAHAREPVGEGPAITLPVSLAGGLKSGSTDPAHVRAAVLRDGGQTAAAPDRGHVLTAMAPGGGETSEPAPLRGGEAAGRGGAVAGAIGAHGFTLYLQ